MPWREVRRKVYECDGCGKPLLDPEYDTTVAFPMGAELGSYDEGHEAGWRQMDNNDWLCPKCWHFCEGTERGDEMPGSEDTCEACKEALADG